MRVRGTGGLVKTCVRNSERPRVTNLPFVHPLSQRKRNNKYKSGERQNGDQRTTEKIHGTEAGALARSTELRDSQTSPARRKRGETRDKNQERKREMTTEPEGINRTFKEPKNNCKNLNNLVLYNGHAPKKTQTNKTYSRRKINPE